MNTKAVRLYGKKDLRLEEFPLPPLQEDEILMEVVSDSVCMSTYKASLLGEEHARVNKDVSVNPIIIGHETSGILRRVGAKWQGRYTEGASYTIQPALNVEGSMATPGYSYHYCGGAATFIILPAIVMEKDCLLAFNSKAGFYNASLAEPMSCIIGAFHSMYHTKRGVYQFEMGIVKGGKSALLACCGPMGMGAIDYMLNGDRRPAFLVVTDIDDNRLARAQRIFPPAYAKERGVELHYLNTKNCADPAADLMLLSGGTGYHDVSVYAPVASVIETGDQILGDDGCLNFFAGPVDKKLSASFNFYHVHYSAHHIVGSSGGNQADMEECLALAGAERINPAVMITHIGGLDSVIDTTLNLPSIPGGKKLIYTGIFLPLTALDDFATLGQSSPLFAALAEIVEQNNGLWCAKAEQYLLAHCPAEQR